MGSTHRDAATAFLEAVSDDAMLDRWIPDEDWVRQIRDNGLKDCTVRKFNTGMTKQCTWQNNCATLGGTTIFHNSKYIQTSKTEARKKEIRFYYGMSAGKLAPTVPSGQGFYQSLWDDPERSNRSLKRKAPPQQAKTPQAKKSKTSPSTRAWSTGEEYMRRCKRIDTSLKSKDENLREKSGKAKNQKLMERIDENQVPNARQQKRGEDLPPRLLGYFPYGPLGLKANVNELETELEAREVAFDRTLGVKKKLEILKKAEQCRFEAVVDRDLLGRRYEYHPELKLPAKIQLIKQDAAEKEEHAGGEYDVDLLKFFKLVSTNVNHTIFEDSH
jgi:hypothetical protein